MKKAILTLTLMASAWVSYALATCSKISYVVTDTCGNRLSFSVVCTNSSGCDCNKMGNVAADFIHDHTSDNGCLHS